MSMPKPRLVADVMLAKLARWIRLSGNSVEDVPSSDDKKIISYVRRRGAVLLTLDQTLTAAAKKRNCKVLLVEGKTIEKQLSFVARKLRLKIVTEPGRICSVCNARLAVVNKLKVMDKLPKASSVLHTKFYLCRKCGRVYWEGTHWRDIRKLLIKAKRLKSRE